MGNCSTLRSTLGNMLLDMIKYKKYVHTFPVSFVWKEEPGATIYILHATCMQNVFLWLGCASYLSLKRWTCTFLVTADHCTKAVAAEPSMLQWQLWCISPPVALKSGMNRTEILRECAAGLQTRTLPTFSLVKCRRLCRQSRGALAAQVPWKNLGLQKVLRCVSNAR